MDRQVSNLDALVVLTGQQISHWPQNIPVYAIPNALPFYPNMVSTCEKKRAIIVGRYTEAKGYDYMIEAWRMVHQKHPDWTIQTFAMGEDEDQVRAKILSYGLQDTIIMNPPTDNIMEEYLNSSMLLMTSVYEPFGLVLPEAMSCGLPVVTFDCPYGPADIITHESDGFIVQDRDISRYADYVCQLIESPGLRQTMGAVGIKASQRYHADKIMPQWQDLFVSLTSKEPSSRRIE
jgi:glycosyltransferase involved in cell wall biosynthesis